MREKQPLIFDDMYLGPRWRYGMTYRSPAGGGIPRGFIIQSRRDDPQFSFGTIDYPFALPDEQVTAYQLTALGKVEE